MPLAQPNTAGFAPANWGGLPIKEIGPVSTVLRPIDCHFGVNPNDIQELAIEALLPIGQKDLAKYGPRSLDMAVRGGIVAESLWEEYQSGSSPHSQELKKFLITFDDVGGKKTVTTAKSTYPIGANISNTDVSGALKYGGTDKTIDSLDKALDVSSEDATGLQYGTRWSKISLESTVLNGGNIIFHLDGMGDVKQICDKQGATDTTSRHGNSAMCGATGTVLVPIPGSAMAST